MRKSMVIAVGLGMILGLGAAWAWAGDAGTSTAPAASANSGPATNPASGPANAAEIAKFIEQLGGETFTQRDAAQEALVRIGPAALPALRAATQDKNPERAQRAQRAVESIQRCQRIPDTVSQVLVKTHMLGKRTSMASPPPLRAEEFLKDIATDVRIAELIEAVANGATAERDLLKMAAIAAIRKYVDQLPESTGPDASWRPIAYQAPGVFVCAYLLSYSDEQPAEMLDLLAQVLLRNQTAMAARYNGRLHDFVCTQDKLLLAMACCHYLDLCQRDPSRKLALNAGQTKAIKDYAALKDSLAGKGTAAESEQVAVLRIVAAFALAGGNRQVRKMHDEWLAVTRQARQKGDTLKAILPSGVEIELLAVSNYPDSDQPWWRPDGTRLDTSPIDPSDMDITSDIDPRFRKIELVFRLGGKADQPACNIAGPIRRTDGVGVWWTGRRSKGGKFALDLKVVGTGVPVDSKAIWLDLLVAAGPWETVATCNGRQAQGPMSAARPADPARASKPSTVITARFDPNSKEARVIGIDANSVEHIVRGFDIRKDGANSGANFLFDGVKPEQFKSFTLQTRPNNELIHLMDISLKPGHMTRAQLNSALPTPQPAPATQPATQPAKPRGATVTGRVLDKSGGKGVKGVTVKLVALDDGAKRSAVTDVDGKYFFEDVRYAGMLQLVQVGEHGPGVWTEDGRVDVPKVGPATTGTTVNATDIYAYTPCTISGMVIDADTGKGIEGVPIRVSTVDRNYTTLKTDDKGAYRLNAIPREVQIDCSGTDDRYLPPDKDPRRTLTVKAGDAVKNVSFTVRSAPAFSGRVLMPDGTPAANMPVLVMLWWSNTSFEGVKRIIEARVRREERIKAGKQAPPPQKKPNAADSFYTTDFNRELRFKTDEAGRFVGYLRLPEIEPEPGLFDVDLSLDLAFVVRTGDKRLAGFKTTPTTTIDPPLQPIEIKLAQTAAAEFVVCDPDGVALAEAKPVAFSWLLDFINMANSIPEAAPDFVNLDNGRYRATGLVPQWDYRIHADANGCKCRTELKVIAKPGETVDAGTLMLDWWGPKAVPGLVEKLADKNWVLRQHTCYELAELGPVSAPAVEPLIALLSSDSDKTVRCAAAEALGKIGPEAKPAVPALIRALETDAFGVPTRAAVALGSIGDPAATDVLKAALVDAEPGVRAAAAGALDNPLFARADANVPALLKLARREIGYQGADLIMGALGPGANQRIASMVHEVVGTRVASATARHILCMMMARQDGSDPPRKAEPQTVLAWWWSFRLVDQVPPNAKLDQAAMAKLWSRLAGDDIVEGYRATLALATGGDDVVTFLAGKLQASAAGDDEIAAMIARLGDDNAAVREQAMAQLALVGRPAEAAMKAALAGNPAAEVRTRLTELLDALTQPYPAMDSTRQAARALRVLEMIGTPAARKALTGLAENKGDDFLSVLARERAARLRERDVPTPSPQPASGVNR